MGLGFSCGEGFKVSDSCPQQGGVVLEAADTSVAVGAKQFSDFPGSVAMVNGQVNSSAIPIATGRQVTNGANAVLRSQHSVVIVESHSVFSQKIAMPLLIIGRSYGMVIQHLLHIGEKWVGGLKFSCSRVSSRMLFAFSEMNKHPFVGVMTSTVSAWFELPSARARFNSAEVAPVNVGVVFSPLVKTVYRTLLAVVVKAIERSRLNGEICFRGFYLLASGTQPFSASKRWEFVANGAPVATESFRSSVVAAKTACNGCFALHVLTVS